MGTGTNLSSSPAQIRPLLEQSPAFLVTGEDSPEKQTPTRAYPGGEGPFPAQLSLKVLKGQPDGLSFSCPPLSVKALSGKGQEVELEPSSHAGKLAHG